MLTFNNHPFLCVDYQLQTYYNKLKGGIDGLTQFLAALAPTCKMELPNTIEQKLTLRTFKQLTAIAGICHRICKVQENIHTNNWVGTNQFRSRCNNVGSIPDVTWELSLDLLQYSDKLGKEQVAATPLDSERTEYDGTNIQEDEAERLTESLQNKKRKTVHDWFNKKQEYKRMRQTTSLEHNSRRYFLKTLSSGIKKRPQRACIICSFAITTYCETCNVPLCYFVRNESNSRSTSCASKFHNCDRLPTFLRTPDYHSAKEDVASDF